MKIKTKRTQSERAAQTAESLRRAITGQSMMNYGPIFEGFAEKGIPMDDIKPRENVFTFNVWRELGRCVKKGEHGVKVVTFVDAKGKASPDGEQGAEAESKGYRFPRTTTVFHVTQTKLIGEPDAPATEPVAVAPEIVGVGA